MLNKEINHNKGELGYVLEPLLKRYHKTLMVSLDNISPNMHFIIDNRTSIKAIKYDIKHGHGS